MQRMRSLKETKCRYDWGEITKKSNENHLFESNGNLPKRKVLTLSQQKNGRSKTNLFARYKTIHATCDAKFKYE